MENNNYSEEILKMRHLMTYGMNENTKKSASPIVEFHQKAADGKTYGILREGQKFYIKVAPQKETEVLAEDYDYIGGFMNKKDYEYTNYATASKQFDLKLQSINEACGKEKAVELKQFQTPQAAEWQVNETKETRQELNRFSRRFNQLLNNVDYILSENKQGKALELGDPHGVGGDPYTQKEEYKEDPLGNEHKDPKTAAKELDKAPAPMEDKVLKNENSNGPKNADDTYKDNAPKPESEGTSVATENGKKNPKADGVKMNESKKGRVFKMTEAQVLAWSKSPDFMDTTKGTEIGSTAPYETNASVDNKEMKAGVEEVSEAIHNSDDMNQHEGPIGDTAPFDKKVNEEEGMDSTMLVDNNGMMNEEESFEIDLDANEQAPVNETKLDVFGKHPAYQKVPMTTPANTEIDKWGKDWNDDSTKGDKPFGTQIGHGGDPYEEVIDLLTDNIMKGILGNKKKVQ